MNAVQIPNSGRWLFPLGSLFSREITKHSSIHLHGYFTRHFAVVSDDIWIPATIDSKACILVHSSESGEHIHTNWLPKIIRSPNAVVAIQDKTGPTNDGSKEGIDNELNENQKEVAVLASTNGLHLLSKGGTLLKTIHKESYADLGMFMDCIYALDYKTKTINTFRKVDGSWQIIQQTQLKYPSASYVFDSRNSIQVVQDGLFLYRMDTERLHKYTMEGVTLVENGEEHLGDDVAGLYGGRLCGCDAAGSLLICDAENQRLQMCTSAGVWQSAMLETRPKYAVCLDGNSFAVIDDRHVLHLYTLELKEN